MASEEAPILVGSLFVIFGGVLFWRQKYLQRKYDFNLLDNRSNFLAFKYAIAWAMFCLTPIGIELLIILLTSSSQSDYRFEILEVFDLSWLVIAGGTPLTLSVIYMNLEISDIIKQKKKELQLADPEYMKAEIERLRVKAEYERQKREVEGHKEEAKPPQPTSIAFPQALRTEHTHILASSGHGKTQLLQDMILNDLEDDCAIIVIDSQRDMVNDLAKRVSFDRLVLVDPETCPPALNIFARPVQNDRELNATLALYEYIFSALEAKLTSKQQLVYRMLARLCMRIEGANLNTMIDLLRSGGTESYRAEIAALPDAAQVFFQEYSQRNNQYNETRQEVLRRILTVTENETFARMLNAPTNALNVNQIIAEGKVLLVSTNKALLGESAKLFGRIFLAEVMRSVMGRDGYRKRTYLYIDEFGDYAEDSPILLDLFTQARKYNLGLIIAHQQLAQLPPQLYAAIITNTAIKFVGAVSSSDQAKMANEIGVPVELMPTKKGVFVVSVKGLPVQWYEVPFGRLKRLQPYNDLSNIQRAMREKYGAPELPRRNYDPPSVQKPEDDRW